MEMLLLHLILMSLMVEQTAHYLTASKIAAPLRESAIRLDVKLGELLSCHECSSFWIVRLAR